MYMKSSNMLGGNRSAYTEPELIQETLRDGTDLQEEYHTIKLPSPSSLAFY